MELIKSIRRRSLLSETIYIILNVALAVALLLLVQRFESPYLAILILLLSKWRVFAVRPRFWFAHLQSNLVDIIVGASYVMLLYLASGSVVAQWLLTALFITWLLVLKPRSKRHEMVWQAGVAQFVGTMALASFSYLLPSSVFVLGMWVITYAAARHVLVAYDENQVTLPSIAYAFLIAELSWFYYHWMVAYRLTANIAVPQLAITVFLLSFTAVRLYDMYHHDGRVRFKDARLPLLFMVTVMAILFVRFTPWNIVL
jgi:hypothetical protein